MIAGFGHGAWIAQVGALLVVGIFTLVVSYILIKVIQIFVPLRVDAETETNGLDLSAHGERAYDMNS
jgi:Amt family ammonium transporter